MKERGPQKCKKCEVIKEPDAFYTNGKYLRKVCKGCWYKVHEKYIIRSRKLYPEKVRAREMLKDRVRRGKIIKGKCVVCGSAKTEGHHEDYNKPLEVIWLCSQHHNDWHGGLLEKSKYINL